jgi:pimeloyl-ACP methyl ester carboxylesterase
MESSQVNHRGLEFAPKRRLEMAHPIRARKNEQIKRPVRLRHFTAIVCLHLIGICLCIPICRAQNFVDLSAEVRIAESGLVFNRNTNTFNSLVTITNALTGHTLNTPLFLIVSNISPSSVTLANKLGDDPSGRPFVSISVPADGLTPGKNISNVLLEFSNPERVRFTFHLSLATVKFVAGPPAVGTLGPVIASIPPAIAVVGKELQYQLIVSSADPASLVISLVGPPKGVTLDSSTVRWTPTADQTGDHAVTVAAKDSTGSNSQVFTISVFNRTELTSTLIHAQSGGAIKITNPTSTINGLTINFPPGALTQDTTVIVSELITPPTVGGMPRFLVKGFSIQPDGITLAKPALLSMPYSPSEFGVNAGVPLADFLGMYFLQASTGNAQWLDGFVINSGSQTVEGPLPHFSELVLMNGYELCAPSANIDACPSDPDLTAPQWAPPTVLVHGFLGDRKTWGSLPSLLNANGIHAWKFDWDTVSPTFESSAGLLVLALDHIEKQEHSPFVDVLAHSFGGILTRTYLEGKSLLNYRMDVNKTMTVGTPHQGIGGSYSESPASGCAFEAMFSHWPATCFEVGTGNSLAAFFGVTEGDFLRSLNGENGSGLTLPNLLSSVTPQYDLIAGQRVVCKKSCSWQQSDGLITTSGNALCQESLPSSAVCPPPPQIVEEVNPGVRSGQGLCHTAVGIAAKLALGCTNNDIGMVAVANTTHPLWPKLCAFLGCFRLLGTWTGSGTITDSEGTETVDISASTFMQTATQMEATIVFTEQGDIPIKNTVTYDMTNGKISFKSTNNSDTEVLTATANYVFSNLLGLVITGSGQDNEPNNPSSGTGSIALSPDGLTLTATNIVINESQGQSTGKGTLKFSADSKQITADASTADGVTYHFSAIRQ